MMIDDTHKVLTEIVSCQKPPAKTQKTPGQKPPRTKTSETKIPPIQKTSQNNLPPEPSCPRNNFSPNQFPRQEGVLITEER